MLVLDGKSVFGGIAIGKIALFEKGDDPVKRKTIEDTNEEIKRFENAKEKAKEELKALYEKALLEVGEANAMIFDVHQMMLDDLDYIESVRTKGKCRVRSGNDRRQFCCDVFWYG